MNRFIVNGEEVGTSTLLQMLKKKNVPDPENAIKDVINFWQGEVGPESDYAINNLFIKVID